MNGDQFHLNQCPNVFAFGRLMYVQVYTRPHIAFSVDARQISDQFKYESLKSHNESDEEPCWPC